MQVSKAAVIFMLLLAALLAAFGVWQFGAIGLRGGEHEREHENAERREHAETRAIPGAFPVLAAVYNGLVHFPQIP